MGNPGWFPEGHDPFFGGGLDPILPPPRPIEDVRKPGPAETTGPSVRAPGAVHEVRGGAHAGDGELGLGHAARHDPGEPIHAEGLRWKRPMGVWFGGWFL